MLGMGSRNSNYLLLTGQPNPACVWSHLTSEATPESSFWDMDEANFLPTESHRSNMETLDKMIAKGLPLLKLSIHTFKFARLPQDRHHDM